jgi:hypothetical protein
VVVEKDIDPAVASPDTDDDELSDFSL